MKKQKSKQQMTNRRFQLRQYIANDLSMVYLWFVRGLFVVPGHAYTFHSYMICDGQFSCHSTTQQLCPEATISERSCSFWPPRKSPANRAATSVLPSQG